MRCSAASKRVLLCRKNSLLLIRVDREVFDEWGTTGVQHVRLGCCKGEQQDCRTAVSCRTFGLRARPVLVLTGLPHICSSFWIMLAAVVRALQLMVATAVPCRTA